MGMTFAIVTLAIIIVGALLMSRYEERKHVVA